VSASSQCLSSAEAVRKEYPGSWPSWTTHAADHKGTKCWFPAMRENHSRHIETLLRKTAEAKTAEPKTVGAKTAEPRTAEPRTAEAKTAEAQTSKNALERRRQVEPVNSKSSQDAIPLASASEMSELGWSFRSRTTKVGPGPVRIFDEFAEV